MALSTADAEYIALSACIQAATWLRKLLHELDMNIHEPTVIMEDNQAAIAITQNPIAHARTKHIDIRYHFEREATTRGTVELYYCPKEMMTADILTKPLPRERFEQHRQEIFGLV